MCRRGGLGPAVALPVDHGLDVDEVLTPIQQLLQSPRRVLELRAEEVNDKVWDERVQEPVAARLERPLRLACPRRHPEPLALAPEQALAGVGAPPEASLVLDAGHVEPVRKPVHHNVVRPESAATLVRRFLVTSHE